MLPDAQVEAIQRIGRATGHFQALSFTGVLLNTPPLLPSGGQVLGLPPGNLDAELLRKAYKELALLVPDFPKILAVVSPCQIRLHNCFEGAPGQEPSLEVTRLPALSLYDPRSLVHSHADDLPPRPYC
jgi:hypothetical protein